MSNLISDSNRQYPAADQAVKVMVPTIINIRKLEYSGGLPESDMKIKISDYFNSLLDLEFDKSDLIALLYDNGASSVNTNMEI